MAELVMAAAAGDGVVVDGVGTVTQMIARLEQMIGSMDQMTELMIAQKLERIPEETKAEMEGTVRNQTDEFMDQMEADLVDTLQKLREGDLESAITILEAIGASKIEHARSSASVRLQVQGILDRLRAAEKADK